MFWSGYRWPQSRSSSWVWDTSGQKAGAGTTTWLEPKAMKTPTSCSDWQILMQNVKPKALNWWEVHELNFQSDKMCLKAWRCRKTFLYKIYKVRIDLNWVLLIFKTQFLATTSTVPVCNINVNKQLRLRDQQTKFKTYWCVKDLIVADRGAQVPADVEW